MTRSKKTIFVPVTPGGTYCMHLESRTENEAIRKLLKDAAHMPYGTWGNFYKRGYRIAKLEPAP